MGDWGLGLSLCRTFVNCTASILYIYGCMQQGLWQQICDYFASGETAQSPEENHW